MFTRSAHILVGIRFKVVGNLARIIPTTKSVGSGFQYRSGLALSLSFINLRFHPLAMPLCTLNRFKRCQVHTFIISQLELVDSCTPLPSHTERVLGTHGLCSMLSAPQMR